MWQEAQSEQTTASPIADFLLPANQAGGYPNTAAAAARAGRSEGSPCQCLQGSCTLHALESQFLYLFRIQSASSMALLIICWILSGLSSSE